MTDRTYTVVTPTATEPLTATEVKLWSKVEVDTDDALITILIQAAREYVEEVCRRALVTTTLKLSLDDWPCSNTLKLCQGKASSVTHVKYYDVDGTQQTLSSSLYFTDFTSEPALIVLKPGEVWPTLDLGRPKAIEITFVAGYGAASAVPAPLKAGMLEMICHWYNHRESVNVGNIVAEIPMTASMLIAPYRLMEF